MQSVEEFRKNFDNVYYNRLLNIITSFEEDRKKALLKAIICLICGIILGFLIPQIYKYCDLFLMNTFSNLSSDTRSDLLGYIIAVPVLIVAGLLITPSIIAKDFENTVKKKVMPTLLNALPKFKWSSKKCITDNFIYNARLFGDYNRQSGDDNFTGKYKNVDVKMWETELGKETGSGKNRTYTVRFKGVLVALEPPRQYKGLTLIKKDNLIDITPQGLEQVNLEDVEFEKDYNVYSDDQIEARYVLTTAFMERFKNIKLAFNASKIEASISEQGILIAISTGRDLFKVGKLWRPVADYEQFKTMADEFASILELIDTLKLEQYIGM